MTLEIGKSKWVEPGECLQQTVLEFRENFHYPELLSPGLFDTTHRKIWHDRGQRNGTYYEISPFPWTQEQLMEKISKRRGISYLPQGLETQENRHKLLGLFPDISSQSVQPGNSVTNIESPSSWFDYDTSIEAAYGNTDEEELMALVIANGEQLLSLNQYIVASYDTKLFWGHFLDEHHSCTRLGSCQNGALVVAHFRPDGTGRMDLSWGIRPKDRYLRMGGRTTKIPSSLWIP